jgi:hypothetical protein
LLTEVTAGTDEETKFAIFIGSRDTWPIAHCCSRAACKASAGLGARGHTEKHMEAETIQEYWLTN